MSDQVATILAYHEQSKHALRRYARGPGHLDWANQPAPFREYAGAQRFELPLAADQSEIGWNDLHVPGRVAPCPVTLWSLGLLLELSLGLAAWKQYQGQRWALRCNPSSGNLHPTEAYLVSARLPDLPPGVYHYLSRDHLLEQRCRFDSPLGLAGSTSRDSVTSVIIGLTSIHWREAWKYGERAFRYCQHDIGHAIAAIRYAAAILGWKVALLDTLDDTSISQLLGLDREADFAEIDSADQEHPDLLLQVGPAESASGLIGDLVAASRTGVWQGRPNPLSHEHVHWKVIDVAATATQKPQTPAGPRATLPSWPFLNHQSTAIAATLIRQRRSCQALDGQTTLSLRQFGDILDTLLPRPEVPPWDVWPSTPRLHCLLFVHRVTGLAPGLYAFLRNDHVLPEFQSATHSRFEWGRVASELDHLPLYRLTRQDLRETAQLVSCHQEIAADGAFSLGMIAEFGDSIRQQGAWWYRRLFWEAGMLGQALYLAAEAAGVRGTGIGCYFDDAVHELAGLTGDRFQSLYHFTVGGALEDQRLTTLPPYGHLNRNPPASGEVAGEPNSADQP